MIRTESKNKTQQPIRKIKKCRNIPGDVRKHRHDNIKNKSTKKHIMEVHHQDYVV